jgi:hypothetical protein
MPMILAEGGTRSAPVLDDARRLAVLVRECVAAGVARRLLLLRLSDLPEDRSRPHHLRLAREAVMPLTAAARAQLFLLPNQDVAVVWRGETPALRQCLDALTLLFADDPAFGPDPLALVAQLALPDDAELVLRSVADSMVPRPARAAARGAGQLLDPPTLASLERAVAQADMTRFARRAPVCRNGADGMRLAWEHRFLSDAELFETMLPDRAPRADPWLFRRLTRALDRRMLALLSVADELRGVAPFSLDLNVASLTGPEFLRFDAGLPTALRGQVTINLRPDDVVADLAGFCFARDFVRMRGYRLLLQDMEASQLSLLPADRLEFDYIQLRHTSGLIVLPPAPEPDRIVLGGADSAAAISWGRAQGISLFQGKLAAPTARRSA